MTEKIMSESIGRWSVGKDKGFTIYQGVLSMKYTIKEPNGIKLEIFHDNTKTKMFKHTTITAKKIWIGQYSGGNVEGTYELDKEDMVKQGNWYTKGNEISEIAHGDDSGTEIYRICGPEKPKCDEHETEEKGCKKCEIKKEDYNINVLVAGHGKNEYQVYNNETTDGSGIKITVKKNKGPLNLTGKIFSCKTS